MKKSITINDYDVIEECLRDFRTYTEGLYIAPESSFFSSELESQLIEYYRTENPKIKAAYKKMIGVAVIQSCYDCPDIPQKYKKNVSQRMADEVLQCVEASGETYNYLCQKEKYVDLVPGTKSATAVHQKAIREYQVVRKAQRIIKVKKIIKRIGERLAVGAAVLKATGSKTLASITMVANSIANVLLPKPVRDEFKAKAEKIRTTVVTQARNVLQNVENKLNETPAGKMVVDVVKKTASFISEVKDAALYAVNEGKKLLRRGWTKLKSALCSW